MSVKNISHIKDICFNKDDTYKLNIPIITLLYYIDFLSRI